MGRRQVDSVLERIGGWLLPPSCVLCGRRGQPPAIDLCADCEAGLPGDAAPLRLGPMPLSHCYAPLRYHHPVDHLVQSLKYRGQLVVGRVLGGLLARSIVRLELQRGVEVLVPVPLHPARHAERGFNQSAEIATRTARELGCGFEPGWLRRVIETRPQVGLGAEERRGNVAGAFVAAPAVAGCRIAIVDDVCTTGATLAAAASALLDAGAATPGAWCIARADVPHRLDCGATPEAGQA